jgi:cytochrome c-type biogenesis protein CcmH
MMMDLWLFWAIAAVLTAMVAVLLIQALRRGAAQADTHPDLKVYRDQLAEVDRDLARGTLAVDEAQRLRIEVSRRLLEADRALQKAAAPGARGSLIWAAGLVVALLGGSLWLYDRIGAAGYADLPLSVRLAMADEAYKTRPSQAQAQANTPPAPVADPDPEFVALMDKLRAAVVARPDDAMGLDLLARNEAALGNYAAALAAQDKLLAVKGDAATPDDRLMAAQIMVAAAGGYVSPEAEAHLIDILQRDPKHGMARYLTGLMFAQVGRPDRAFQIWQPLLEEGPPDAPWVQAVKTDIQGVADQAGIKFSLPADKGPTAADMAAAGDMTAEDRQAMIAGMVGQLEERLLSQGGPVEEWIKLINALQVLDQPDRGRAALASAEAALAADPAGLQAVRDAAAAAGFAP